MSISDPLIHLGSIWYNHSEPLEVPYSPDQEQLELKLEKRIQKPWRELKQRIRR